MSAAGMVVSIAAAISVLASHAGWLRISHGLGIAAALLVAGILVAPRRPDLRFILLALGLTAALPIALYVGDPSSAYPAARQVALLGLAWAMVLPAWGAPAVASDRRAGRGGPVGTGLLIVGLVGLAFVFRWALAGEFSRSVDENLYLMQAAHLFRDAKGIEVDTVLAPFLRIRQTFLHEGVLYGQYPVGWPLALGAFYVLGLESLAGVIVYGLSLIGVVMLARSLGISWSSTGLAVALTGLCASQLFFVNSHFAHGISSVFALFGGCCAVRATRSEGGLGWTWWVLSGLLVAMVGTARPLTGLVAAAGLGWWILFVVPEVRARVIGAVSVAAGAVLPIASVLWYNVSTTGDPMRFGYASAHGGLQSLGFGDRGWVSMDPAGLPVEHAADFEVLDGLMTLSGYLGQGAWAYWPGGLILMLAALHFHSGQRISWRIVTPFLFLPLAYSLYFFTSLDPRGPRFLSEAVPFAMVATVVFVDRLRQQGRGVGAMVCWLTVALTSVTTLGLGLKYKPIADAQTRYFQLVEAERDRGAPLLIFVVRPVGPQASPEVEHALEGLFWYNAQPMGDVVVGRDIPELREAVMDRFPHHRPFRFVSGTPDATGHWGEPSLAAMKAWKGGERKAGDTDESCGGAQLGVGRHWTGGLRRPSSPGHCEVAPLLLGPSSSSAYP
ncbi:MAG: hypothetical protein ACR2QM_02700 [Longimicrobiales bacterium]